MLNLIGKISLSAACQCKTGGVIVNEHTLDRRQTRSHVELLGRWFEFIHLKDLPERLRRRGKKPFCLLTFDDGKRSNATEVAPELERLGVPAVFYVVTSSLGSEAPLWFDRYRALRRQLGAAPNGLSLQSLKQLPYVTLSERIDRACSQHGIDADLNDDDVALMTWEQARALHWHGFSIGAHGYIHAILTRETKTAAMKNIEKSIAKVSEEIGEPCPSFAFPNGNYTPELAQHAVRCGVKTVMTTEPMWADPSVALWRLPRLQIFGEDSPGKISLKIAVAATGFLLRNPDGTGRHYRTIDRMARQGLMQNLAQCEIPQLVDKAHPRTEARANVGVD